MKKLTKSAGSLATKLVCLAVKRLQSRTGTRLCLCTSQTMCPFTTCATWLVSTAKAATKSIFNMTQTYSTTDRELLEQMYRSLRNAYRSNTDSGILDVLDEWMQTLQTHLEQNEQRTS